jgi:hypothetical protein
MLNRKPIRLVISSLLFILFFVIIFVIERHETELLITSYSLTFVLYVWIILKGKKEQLLYWIFAAIAFRLLVTFGIPNLSDDFYRFIWDGKLLSAGFHPFAQAPSYYVENNITVPGTEGVYSNLNSKNYYTVYPPLAQFVFWICVQLSDSVYGALLVLKILIFAADIGTIFLLKKLLTRLKLPGQRVLLYALNPLVIVELTGNGHFEAILIFFLVLSCLFIVRNRLWLASFFFALSICIKLIPLLFLPAMFPLLGRKKAIAFCAATAGICLILFLPLLDLDIIQGFKNSLGYYFSRFEFNASLYYLVRAAGYLILGYNIIYIAGAALGAMACILILKISFNENSLTHNAVSYMQFPQFEERMVIFFYTAMWSMLIYFLFTTTLHPWYITTLLAISIFTRFRFAVLWTFTIFLTYSGYSAKGFDENLWIVAFEYVTVIGYLGYELKWEKHSTLSLS